MSDLVKIFCDPSLIHLPSILWGSAMHATVLGEIRGVLPTMAFSILFPLPIVQFWQDGAGRGFAFAYLFLGCAVLVADCFGQSLSPAIGESPEATDRRRLWHAKITAMVLACGIILACFTGVFWAISGLVNFRVPILAALIIMPALCTIPWLTILTRKPFAAVLFGAGLLGLIKIVGCWVVRIVYGPNALADGYMNLAWDHPNLLVRFCFVAEIAYSITAYFVGFRLFLKPSKHQNQGLLVAAS